jgi:hypothetical protein
MCSISTFVADEPGRRARHDDAHAVAARVEQARDLHRLVGADAARDAEADERHAAYSASVSARPTAPAATS